MVIPGSVGAADIGDFAGIDDDPLAYHNEWRHHDPDAVFHHRRLIGRRRRLAVQADIGAQAIDPSEIRLEMSIAAKRATGGPMPPIPRASGTLISKRDPVRLYQRLIILTRMTGISLAFGQARSARWYRYHEAIATPSKSQSNPASGGTKSPTGQRCSARTMPRIARREAPRR